LLLSRGASATVTLVGAKDFVPATTPG